jgi:hypothetical protein
VSNLPISSPYRSTPDVPVSDAERDQLTSRLNAAYTAGSLGQDDYRARLDRLYAAQTLGQLVPVVDGLPPLQTYADPAGITSGGRPGELEPARDGNRFTLLVVAGVALVVVLLAMLMFFAF